MRKTAVVLAVTAILALAGCSRSGGHNAAAASSVLVEKQAIGGPAFVPPPEIAVSQAEPTQSKLSYEHTLVVELPAAQLAPAYQGLLHACGKLGEALCINFKSSLLGDESLMAELRLRVKRGRVAALIEQASVAGKVLKQETTAEDLGSAIFDVKRRLAMKVALRDDLLALRARSRDNIDALLKVTEKLDQVQSEIEAATGEQAGYQDRLEMDWLTIDLRSTSVQRSSGGALVDALRSSGTNFVDGLASLINFVASALPWLLLLLALPVVLRLMRLVWRWTRRVA